MEVQQIPIGKIKPSPMNPRKTFDEADLQELADSIKHQGLLQPITVRPSEFYDEVIDGEIVSTPTNYEIVCGERRYRALLINAAGDENYPVLSIVRDLTDDEAFDAMVTENLQRIDVDPVEEAFAFEQLQKRGSTIEEIAVRFGKSTRFVVDRIKLNNLIPELLIKVKDGRMAINAGLMISKLEEDDQRKFHERYSTWEKIGKENAVRFCNEIFQFIRNAPWYCDDREDFDGGCGLPCAKCHLNTINAGCLFYEMKADEVSAKCTNKSKYQEKKFAYCMSLIDAHADKIVKIGESMEQGKIAVVSDISGYCVDKETANKFIEACKSKGYEVFKCDDVFERYSSYDVDDERLQEKLANHEVYRCLCISSWHTSIDVIERFYEFKKDMEGVDNETVKESVTVANLTRKYKEICDKCRNKRDLEIAGLFSFRNCEMSNDDLTEEENDALYAYMLSETSWEFRRELLDYSAAQPMYKYFDYVVSHPDDRNKIMREWLRNNLNRVDSWGAFTGQMNVAKQWHEKELAEIIEKFNKDLDKKTSKTAMQLGAMGYDTDGVKIKE